MDRHTGAIIPAACTSTKVLVSTDSTPVDQGSFQGEHWASQALQLKQGWVVVNYDVITANLPGAMEKQRRRSEMKKTKNKMVPPSS